MSLLSIDELKTLVDQSQSPCVSLYMPTYNGATGTEVRQNPTRFKNLIKQDEDLLNVAAVQTILNGGKVYAVPPDAVPDESRVAAVFRY